MQPQFTTTLTKTKFTFSTTNNCPITTFTGVTPYSITHTRLSASLNFGMMNSSIACTNSAPNTARILKTSFLEAYAQFFLIEFDEAVIRYKPTVDEHVRTCCNYFLLSWITHRFVNHSLVCEHFLVTCDIIGVDGLEFLSRDPFHNIFNLWKEDFDALILYYMH